MDFPLGLRWEEAAEKAGWGGWQYFGCFAHSASRWVWMIRSPLRGHWRTFWSSYDAKDKVADIPVCRVIWQNRNETKYVGADGDSAGEYLNSSIKIMWVGVARVFAERPTAFLGAWPDARIATSLRLPCWHGPVIRLSCVVRMFESSC